MGFFARFHSSPSPKGQPQHSDAETPGAYYAVTPTMPRFRFGYCWYPGVTSTTAFGGHNKTGWMDTNPAALNLVPPRFPSFAVNARRSVAAGARDNARYGYPLVTTRVIMPEVPRR